MSEFGKIVGSIVEDFYRGRFDLSARDKSLPAASWSSMPQVECATYLRDAGACDRTVLLYLTFMCALDRARSSERLWWNGLELYENHPEVFDPLNLLAIAVDELTELLSQCKLSKNEQDSQAWSTIAQSIALESSCPVSRVIYGKSVDAKHLLKDLGTRADSGKSRFPLLSGTKTSLSWIRTLCRPGNATITHLDALPITVDAHVIQASENLGMVKSEKLDGTQDADYIQSVWRSAMATIEIEEPDDFQSTCTGLDPALAFFSRYGCGHCEKVGQPVRIGLACNHCKLFL